MTRGVEAAVLDKYLFSLCFLDETVVEEDEAGVGCVML